MRRGELCHIFGVTVSQSTEANASSLVVRWPQAKAEVLREVLHFVYTSKIQMQEEIFEALAIAVELGLEELATIYEQHINATINVHKACEYLDAVLALKRRLSENDWNRIVQMCMQFINANAAECANTQGFINLSKQGITHLVSSDYFSLDEADVFRHVLAWAKHQTGVTKPTQQWVEKERRRVTEQLSGVVNHIRILLIDSQVFAEEVEPTGVLPIELTLERYRCAALAGGNKIDSQRKQVQPRLTPSTKRHFIGSNLLSEDAAGEQEQILNAWYGVPKQTWRLIFRASSHGFSADAFHAQCDGVAPTYVLVLSSQGYLSGGFSDVPWRRGDGKGRGRFETSEKAFLFNLRSPGETSVQQATPSRYECLKRMFAIAQHAHFGPVFGAGADLSIADQCNLNDQSYSNFPHTYGHASLTEETRREETLFGAYNFTVADYEVFTLAD